MKSTPLTKLVPFCFVLLLFSIKSTLNAQCISGTTVSTFSGASVVYTCPGDGNVDIIKFKPSSFATQYAFIVTNENNEILAVPSGNSVNFEGAGVGVCRVWGVSFAGVISATPGQDITTDELSDFCYELSDNYVEVFRTDASELDGGMVSMPSGATTRYTCPGDGNADVVQFTTDSNAPNNYAYVITDEDFNILGLPPGNSQDFEGADQGVCLVWGLSYSGNIIAQPGDNAASVQLADGCFDLSDNYITVIRSHPDGGTVAMPNGNTTRSTCAGDGEADVVMFENNSGSGANYAYVITDEDFNILGLPPGNSQDFEGAGQGTCLVWGLSYTGSITAQAGDNAATVALSSDCYDLSDNYITIIRTGVDGGMVSMPSGATTRYTCPGDGNADVIQFTTDSNAPNNYAYVITDEDFNILGLPPGNSQDFEGAGQGVCLVWGLSYSGNIIAQPGDNAASVQLADGCFDLSDNYITVIRSHPDGGTVAMPNGNTTRSTCAGDGEADVVMFENNSGSGANYAYVITDEDFNILGLPPGNSQDFEGAGQGTCLVWGLSYTGSITAQAGDNAATVALSSDCYDLSDNYITIIRTGVDGGMVSMPSGATTRYTCPGDGNADVIQFTTDSNAPNNYAYVITDEDFNILGLPPGNSQDFEGAGQGVCLVWGLSYSGNIIAQPGDNAASTQLADGCFDLSDNYITVIRSHPDGGTVAMPNGNTTRNTCAGDGEADVVMFENTSGSGANYAYVITDEDFNILGLPPGNSQDFEGAGQGVCLVWGLSYTGSITAQAGDNAATVALSSDCYDLSDNYITIIRTGVGAGSVSIDNGETEVTICVGDGEDDIINFANSSTAGSNYQYVITDENNNILGLPPGNSQNFEGAGVGICRVWGLSYTGNIVAEAGDLATGVALSDGCFVLTDNYIQVIRMDDDITCPTNISISGSNVYGQTSKRSLSQSSLELYPNPISNLLNLNFDQNIMEQSEEVIVSIHDSTGKLIYQNRFSENRIEVSTASYSSGMYFLSLKAGDISINRKFIKQ